MILVVVVALIALAQAFDLNTYCDNPANRNICEESGAMKVVKFLRAAAHYQSASAAAFRRLEPYVAELEQAIDGSMIEKYQQMVQQGYAPQIRGLEQFADSADGLIEYMAVYFQNHKVSQQLKRLPNPNTFRDPQSDYSPIDAPTREMEMVRPSRLFKRDVVWIIFGSVAFTKALIVFGIILLALMGVGFAASLVGACAACCGFGCAAAFSCCAN
ncbi:hypothetical protein MIR68_010540 [Amoeboaphelidium protococcarum]|nr:hypothetical protein MIR68_010540 [Amoeboaphelidium protococcarum]